MSTPKTDTAAAVPAILRTMDQGPAPESAAAAHAWLDARGRRFGHFVGGAWTTPGATFATHDPADGTQLADVAHGDAADVDRAVAAAAAAQPAWEALGGHGRARHLYALSRALQRHARLFAVLETLDNGKPIRETRDLDVPLAARHFLHHAGWAQTVAREFPGARALGVVGQIVPWNFPLLMLAWKAAPALAAGNTVVFKPAEQTPLTALRFAALCDEVGLPPGVFNLVAGDGATGRALVAHAGVAKIAFTGSTEVGREIRRATAGSGKRLALELGGKSPFIVFADADLDAAVEGLVDGIWLNQGQVCCAGSRVLVHEPVAADFERRVVARMARLRVGPPLDKSTDVGTLVDRAQHARVDGFVERARAAGARVVQASDPACAPPAAGGCFYPPTLVLDVDGSFEIVRDEVFGPVATWQTFRTPAEAVELANNTAYGLAACVWSETLGTALHVAPRLAAGVVWVNASNLLDAACGFGGVRESGFGRDGGREGFGEYLRGEAETGAARAAGTAPAPPLSTPAAGASGAAAATAGASPAGAADDTAGGAVADADPTGSTGLDLPSAAAAAPGAPAARLHAALDRTPKLSVGGRQVRPDGGYSRDIVVDGRRLATVPVGNRKDIRNAVEAARAAAAWSRTSPHGRAQVLYFLAENLDAQRPRLVEVLAPLMIGAGRAGPASTAGPAHAADAGTLASARHADTALAAAHAEVDRAVAALFDAAALGEQHEGRVHQPPQQAVVLALHEPLGIVGIVAADASPLAGLLALVAPALAFGNRVVALPSVPGALLAAELAALADTSDVPPGVLNLVTGDPAELGAVLAQHHEVAALWSARPETMADFERLSATNLKRTWLAPAPAAGDALPRGVAAQAVQVKNVWVPYGV